MTTHTDLIAVSGTATRSRLCCADQTGLTRPTSARRGRKPNAEISDPRPARQRLLDAANELFYTEGVQSVGIDRIIEYAGVAKGSLYNTFGSKEALVRAYLESRHEGTTQRLSAVIDAVDDPRENYRHAADMDLCLQPSSQRETEP
ncbi:hypothetical protein FMEAI12_4290007 [Parafrankia sp. Ea1.12]|nr:MULTISPECIES: TetR/AcrR family transcriptional regulator [unclassified Parafrankia]SQD97772.1 hypothetical protein FMEAI12_4290007 [Parafrankia sp. Ea1.12]